MNKRFFAFGCSYTNYFYPTWADIIGNNFNEYYNYGQAGAGNRYIFNAVIEANVIHKFTKDDVIFIEWSGIERVDMYINDAWKVQLHHNKDYLLKWVHFKDKLMESLTYMTVVKDLFKLIGLEYTVLTLTNLDADIETFNKENCDMVTDFYKDTVDTLKCPGFHNSMIGNRNRPINIAGRDISDGHHFPWEHYDYIEKFLPEYLPKISNLRQQLIDVYEQAIDPTLNEMDQNIAFERANWPVKIDGVKTFKFSSINHPLLIKNNND